MGFACHGRVLCPGFLKFSPSEVRSGESVQPLSSSCNCLSEMVFLLSLRIDCVHCVTPFGAADNTLPCCPAWHCFITDLKPCSRSLHSFFKGTAWSTQPGRVWGWGMAITEGTAGTAGDSTGTELAVCSSLLGHKNQR